MVEKNDIYLVASLPRSGTTSICEMASIVGLKSIHASPEDFPDLLHQGFNFFADTPYYDPCYLICLFQHHKNIKVIYIDRPLGEIEKSYLKTNLINYYLDVTFTEENVVQIPKHPMIDVTLWQRIHNKKLREDHKLTIKGLCSSYGIEILYYNFSEGWEPFCKFVGKPIPEQDVPRLNAAKEICTMSI